MARTGKTSAKGTRGRKEVAAPKTRKGGGEVMVELGGGDAPKVHVGSRDDSYRGTVHWSARNAGKAYLIKPPGGPKVELEFCKPLPVSGSFDIETSGGAIVTRDP